MNAGSRPIASEAKCSRGAFIDPACELPTAPDERRHNSIFRHGTVEVRHIGAAKQVVVWPALNVPRRQACWVIANLVHGIAPIQPCARSGGIDMAQVLAASNSKKVKLRLTTVSLNRNGTSERLS